MAVSASQDCLTGMDKSKLDAIYMASTTMPFADRDNAGVLKAALNLKDNITSADFATTMKAGTTALITAIESVKGGDKHQILVTASDNRITKTASVQELRFGDGAASLLIGDENVIAEYLGSYSLSYDFVDHFRGPQAKYDYNWEERWIRDEGYAKIYPEAIQGLLDKMDMSIGDISKMIYPCLIARAHATIAKNLGANPEQIVDTMGMETGECGTAHPYVMLARELEKAEPGEKILVAGYGQGADVLLFQVTDNIKKLPPRVGVSGYLNYKKEEETYTKWLQFNELITSELGARAEVDNRTALSTLWRNRKLILGFVGGKCRECGTPQIPSDRICVNPDCNAVDSQDEYEFADKPAKILTFTGDNLAASLDPPAIYGMIQFDDGGRMMMDFTDCSLDNVEVGVAMKPSFRKKYVDQQRGFTGYFWKAVPQL
jgi:3-hydroxy-3-methylglutaryl CoA synthase